MADTHTPKRKRIDIVVSDKTVHTAKAAAAARENWHAILKRFNCIRNEDK